MQMNLRNALKERKMLDARISQKVDNFKPFMFYKKSDAYISGTMTPEDGEKIITETWQSINDMIERREKINTAINKANASVMVKVDKYVNFNTCDTEPVEQEEISIACAINRKKYYENNLKRIFDSIAFQHSALAREVDAARGAAFKELNSVLQQRFSASKESVNITDEQYQKIVDKEKDNFEIVLVDPLKFIDKYSKIAERVQSYLNTIDNVLSHITETTIIEIED